MTIMTQNEILPIIFDNISEGVFTIDHDCKITSFNRAAEEISGFSKKEAVGKYCFDVFRTNLCKQKCALISTLKDHKPIRDERVTIMTKDGRKVVVSVSTMILRDDNGRTIGAVEFFRDLTMIEDLRKQIKSGNKLGEIVSCNEEMQRIFSILPEIAKSECNVLIQGPSGSGKELISLALHNMSPHAGGAFVKINCAALPEPLLESELFGHVKGAFTDALRDKPGLFYVARDGSLLLDELSEMSLPIQAKLLRVLNNGEFLPVGATDTLHTNARIIAATNQNLEQMIAAGRFREDLYYRINVINIDIPPLKQRLEDIPLLIEHFINKLRSRTGKSIRNVSPETLSILRQYDFPGNVRELENAVEHAFVLCSGETICPEHLPVKIQDTVKAAANGGKNGFGESSEEAVIRETLQRHNGNRENAARELGMHRTTLWRKMKRYCIKTNLPYP